MDVEICERKVSGRRCVIFGEGGGATDGKEAKRSLFSNLALDVCLFLLAVNEEGRAAAVRAKMVAFV